MHLRDNGMSSSHVSAQKLALLPFLTLQRRSDHHKSEAHTRPFHICDALCRSLNSTTPSSLIPYLALNILHHFSSPRVRTFHPSLASSALFMSFELLNPNPLLLLDRQRVCQLSKCTFLFSSFEPHTHCLKHLSNSLCIFVGNFCNCIWKTGRLLITAFAKVIRPALERHLLFHPSSLFFTFSRSYCMSHVISPTVQYIVAQVPSKLLHERYAQ